MCFSWGGPDGEIGTQQASQLMGKLKAAPACQCVTEGPLLSQIGNTNIRNKSEPLLSQEKIRTGPLLVLIFSVLIFPLFPLKGPACPWLFL
jgi:hypothetical protein